MTSILSRAHHVRSNLTLGFSLASFLLQGAEFGLGQLFGRQAGLPEYNNFITNNVAAYRYLDDDPIAFSNSFSLSWQAIAPNITNVSSVLAYRI